MNIDIYVDDPSAVVTVHYRPPHHPPPVAIVDDANMHWIGTFVGPIHMLLIPLRQNAGGKHA